MIDIQPNIKALDDQINTLLSSNSKRKKNKAASLKKKLWKEIRLFLLSSNERFKEVNQKNLDILSSSKIIFKVLDTGRDGWTNHATELDGKMLPNGFLYIDTTDTDFPVFGYQSHLYPKQFTGTMNGLCETSVKVSKRGYRFFGSRVPLEFEGTCDKNGNLILNITKWEWEFTGNNYMSKLMCDPFNKDNDKRRDFLDNKMILISMMKEFKAEALKDN